MTYSRYSRREIFINKNRQYKNTFFKNRDVEQIPQYDVGRIGYPTPAEINSLTNDIRVWRATDTLYNLSNQYYGSPTYWWVIAWYNKKASEAEFTVGEQFFVPSPLEDVLGYIK
jgi:hypothetical protein